jgi:hypothetical protein
MNPLCHLHAKIIKRSHGQSIIAKAAYNSRVALIDENTGSRKDYRYKGESLFSKIFIPSSAPG